jgi:hypothetical protein
MAERLEPLPATPVTWVRSPVPARLALSVEQLAFFCDPASGEIFSSTAIAFIIRKKFAIAKAKVFQPLGAWVRVGRGIPHAKGYNSSLRLRYLKE